ncbi:hypothetical protein, conserved [Eimeria praecox]|uniref:Uncharacterized protein n=1 Tax=Eimeria praecox TaxID=51316 RepID=U6H6J7_9EIME|nr:hypothetical protein, conserved [Eimeria praecox]
MERLWFVYISVSWLIWAIILLCVVFSGTFAAFTKDDGDNGETETIELEPPKVVVELEQSPAARGGRALGAGQGAASPLVSPSTRSPDSITSTSKGTSRRNSPYGGHSGSAHSPQTARQALRLLKKRLGGGDSAIQVSTLQEWLDEKLSEGRISRPELMKAVIAVTGEGFRFVDRAVPSTRTDLLRRAATQLSIGPSELRRLAQEVKGDPSLLAGQTVSGGVSPFQPASRRDVSILDGLQSRMPSPVSQVSTQMSLPPEPLETSSSASMTPEVPARVGADEGRLETPVPVGAPKTRKKLTLDLTAPVAERSTPEGSEGARELEPAHPSGSEWLLEIEELLRGPAPPTPSPQVEEALSFSPETQRLLASIPPLPGKPIPESTKELLDYSPYMGVTPRWEPSVETGSMDVDVESIGSISDPSLVEEMENESMDDIARQVDDIIAELQQRSEADVQLVSEGTSMSSVLREAPDVEGLRALSPEGRGASVEDESMSWMEGGDASLERALLKDEDTFVDKGFQQPPDTNKEIARPQMPRPSKGEVNSVQTASLASSNEEVPLEQTPHVPALSRAPGSRRESLKAKDMTSVTDRQTKRPRLWDRTKAVAQEHKTLLQVTGGVALGALVVAALVALHKKLNRRLPSSSPLISTVEPKKCHVLVDFLKGMKLKAMGKVTRIEKVEVNNAKRTLTVEYLERPAVHCSRGREFFKWMKYYATLGRSLVRRVEKIPFPDSCMGGPYSRFQVAEENGSVLRLFVDLELNPGPLAVPRELMDGEQLDELLAQYEKDLTWKLYEDCVMHITIEEEFLGSPIVTVDTARGRVGFQNPELRHHSSQLPKECDWREPWKLRIAYKSVNDGPLELLLLMSAADPPIEETVTLEREAGNAASDDPDDVLQDIRTLFEE